VNIDYEQLFLRAASIIEAYGWKRGAMFVDRSRMFDDSACCALGAVWRALCEQRPDLRPPHTRDATLPVDHLQCLKEDRVLACTEGRYLSSWSDWVCPSQDACVAKLREIATVFA